jgi:hypothetical protein
MDVLFVSILIMNNPVPDIEILDDLANKGSLKSGLLNRS